MKYPVKFTSTQDAVLVIDSDKPIAIKANRVFVKELDEGCYQFEFRSNDQCIIVDYELIAPLFVDLIHVDWAHNEAYSKILPSRYYNPDDRQIQKTDDGQYCLVDTRTGWVKDFPMYLLSNMKDNNLIQICFRNTKKCGVINKNGEVLIPLKYYSILEGTHYYLGQIGFFDGTDVYDLKGKFIFHSKYLLSKDVRADLFQHSGNEYHKEYSTGYVTLDDELILEEFFNCQKIYRPSGCRGYVGNNLFISERNIAPSDRIDRACVVNIKGKVIIPYEYERIIPFQTVDRYVFLCKNPATGHYKILDETNQDLCLNNIDEYEDYRITHHDQCLWLLSEGTWTLFDRRLHKITTYPESQLFFNNGIYLNIQEHITYISDYIINQLMSENK